MDGIDFMCGMIILSCAVWRLAEKLGSGLKEVSEALTEQYSAPQEQDDRQHDDCLPFPD